MSWITWLSSYSRSGNGEGGSHVFPKYWDSMHWNVGFFFSLLQGFALFYVMKSVKNTGTIWNDSTLMMLTIWSHLVFTVIRLFMSCYKNQGRIFCHKLQFFSETTFSKGKCVGLYVCLRLSENGSCFLLVLNHVHESEITVLLYTEEEEDI